MSDGIIPKHLESTLNMLKRAYPNGISDKECFPLMSLLYEHMSDRNLAEVISFITGKEVAIALNDIHKSVSTKQLSEQELNMVREKLLEHGFEKWIDE
ncbi:DUF3349 domain-containing protein [Brevibacillus sp. HB1.2]|uniref:DUF3349 domain-containing protein n=1 Tax=Brevibacillus TaxID=55080 RepID=UPI00156B5962|nr:MULTISPECIES: DUF3349 domain-containing protein [unclassified Brevibacillus]NRS19715.1 DUF3349 domain-containing protein [Brevibacillus sp. HB1.4B]NTU21996.1 DUF3349 domain-containing protein [Brevibacillus sp. HB1.2]